MNEPESLETPVTTPGVEASALSHPPAMPETALPPTVEPAETKFLKWLLFGSAGLRIGWSAAMFVVVYFLFTALFSIGIMKGSKNLLHLDVNRFGAVSAIAGELGSVLALLVTMLILAKIERRKLANYYLGGPRGLGHFVGGYVGGFAALSLLVGVLFKAGFLQFSGATDPVGVILKFGLLWGIAFLLVGLSEEGTFRTYLLYTLARGINFWVAAGFVGTFCLFAFLNKHGNGSGGVYLMGALGLIPCLLLQLKKSPSAGFWQATWFSSTVFGYVHTFNPGESWIGIFSAAAIGFVFCASIRLTGSAWWAIGFHAAWDWAQTFFYGTPDSGLQPVGHYLTTTPKGAVLWSGGTAGPEGSVLVLPIIVLTLAALVVLYRRRAPVAAL